MGPKYEVNNKLGGMRSIQNLAELCQTSSQPQMMPQQMLDL